eukprot:CAMPEP_0178640002 /NCGR_PEP_ID=MMETSP0698-20121128/15778_1 /TAXON_ID=265572 /ORGANISM="Extubocellulus spinifer, Strain CCMP396" /LENGTH=51 /DNA_ID=CAMNT_0020280401 /DNA_START=43 /DNA_END=198 /DNA_ORIENTATION=-
MGSSATSSSSAAAANDGAGPNQCCSVRGAGMGIGFDTTMVYSVSYYSCDMY